jgi:parallel beta-helix repeat protein
VWATAVAVRRAGRVLLLTILAGALADVAGLTATAQAQVTRHVDVARPNDGDCVAFPCGTISYALSVAGPGDTIEVGPGTYDDSFGIRHNGITLRSTAGPEQTIIRGGAVLAVVQTGIQTNDPVLRFTLEGFTITDTGALSGTAGINLDSIVTFGAVDFVIRHNIIRVTGTGIELSRMVGPVLVENNLIVNNGRHGIHNFGAGQMLIRNNTIAYNGSAGYREQFGTGRSSIVNNIVAFNGATMGNTIHPAGIEIGSSIDYQVSFNNVFANANGSYGRYRGGSASAPYEPSPGTGELSVDPRFIDPSQGDYRLAPGSPSIDAGTNDNAPEDDFDGRARPLDGDGDGTAVVDMGAFEVMGAAPGDATAPTVTASGVPSEIGPGGPRAVTVTVTGAVTDDTAVDLTSGTFAVTDEYGELEPEGTFAIAEDGSYTFTVPLEASRLGSDRDGRRYLITVTAEDTAGNIGLASTKVVVLHDRRADGKPPTKADHGSASKPKDPKGRLAKAHRLRPSRDGKPFPRFRARRP